MTQNKKLPAVSANLTNKTASSASPFGARQVASLPNPFAARRVVETEPEEIADDAAYYKLNTSGPSLAATDVDSATRAVEVQVLWGEYDAIHLSLLSPPRGFVLGEQGADFAMDGAQLGATRYPLTVVEGGETFVIVPRDAQVSVRNRGVERRLSTLHAEGALTVTDVLEGATRYRLADEDIVRVRRAGFVFQVKSVAAPKRIASVAKVDFTPAYYVSGAASIIGMLMVALALSNPSGGTLSNGSVDTSSRLVQSLINPPDAPDQDVAATNSNSAASSDGRRASGDEGQAGRPDRPQTNRRRTVASSTGTDGTPAASNVIRDNQVLSTISTMAGSLLSQSSPYSAGAAVGSDPMSQQGALLGLNVGENGGIGGLGQLGSGLGGGNPLTDLLAAGGLQTHGDRPGAGGPGGPGMRPGHGPGDDDLGPRRGADVTAPVTSVAVNGSIPSDVIRRVIQRNIGQVRFCYEQGLTSRPDMQGRVTVRFMISPSGAVQTALIGSSTLGDPRVESCIAGAMRRLTFPAPDGGGMVSVSYPFVLSSGQ